MAKFIVLKIDDEECAQAVLKNPPQGAELVAAYAVPTKFCECTNLKSKDGYLVNNQFVRGTKFGLYVHRDCKLPRAGHTHYPQNLLLVKGKRERYGFGATIIHPFKPLRSFDEASE